MPTELDLDGDDFAQTPWAYPGRVQKRPAVLHRGCLHALEPVARRRLGKSRVEGTEKFARTPLNEFIYDTLLPRERLARGDIAFPE